MYEELLPPSLIRALARGANAGGELSVGADLPGFGGGDREALEIAGEAFLELGPTLESLLAQRAADRAFIDAHTSQDGSADALGRLDPRGRLPFGPHAVPTAAPAVELPPELAPPHVCFFAPPSHDGAALEAARLGAPAPEEARAFSAARPVGGAARPVWGADLEDSLSPRPDLLRGAAARVEAYAARRPPEAPLPLVRLPGLALPDGARLFRGAPLPLHLTTLADHLWRHRARASTLYLPKLETEAEARYFAELLAVVEARVQARFPAFARGSTRVIVVFETARAIFRIGEIASALGSRFAGGSLGWHDFLASAARLFRNDATYRIPPKSSPDIVVESIRASHLRLARALAGTGALKIGGMYGLRPAPGHEASRRAIRLGFARDALTQLGRGLDGFWVADPSLVRPGLGLAEAWRAGDAEAGLEALLPDPVDRAGVRELLEPDAGGPEASLRAVLAAEGTEGLPPLDEREVRAHVRAGLRYLGSWLAGEANVALETTRGYRGATVPAFVVDDLATLERTRWEIGAEIVHRRFSRAAFERILEGEALRDRWGAVAAPLLHRLVLAPHAVEHAVELLMPFMFSCIRDAPDPWAEAQRSCPGKYREP